MNTINVQYNDTPKYISVSIGESILAVSSAFGTTLLHKEFLGMDNDFEDLSDAQRELEEC